MISINELLVLILKNHLTVHNLVVAAAAFVGILSLWWRWNAQNRNAAAAEEIAKNSRQAKYWEQFETFVAKFEEGDNIIMKPDADDTNEKKPEKGTNAAEENIGLDNVDFGGAVHGIQILARGMELGTEDHKALFDRVCGMIRSRSICQAELDGRCEGAHLKPQNFSDLIRIVAPSTLSKNKGTAKKQRNHLMRLLTLPTNAIQSIIRLFQEYVLLKSGRELQHPAQLWRIKLPEGCDLSQRDFERASFARAKLVNCNLREANFNRADLRHADLSGCNLRGATLKNANLHGATLIGADCTGAEFDGAILRSAVFGMSKSKGATTQEPVPKTADTAVTETEEATAIEATREIVVEAQVLKGAILRKATFRGAILSGTDLTNCDLTGTNLRPAVLVGAKLAHALCYDKTIDEADRTKIQNHAIWDVGDMVLANWEEAEMATSESNKLKAHWKKMLR